MPRTSAIHHRRLTASFFFIRRCFWEKNNDFYTKRSSCTYLSLGGSDNVTEQEESLLVDDKQLLIMSRHLPLSTITASFSSPPLSHHPLFHPTDKGKDPRHPRPHPTHRFRYHWEQCVSVDHHHAERHACTSDGWSSGGNKVKGSNEPS